MMKNTEARTFDNGVKAVMVPVEGLRSVTIEVFVDIGAKYEENGEFGMSHFLEHMAFKGTKKRPSPLIINKEIEGKGAAYNAETSLEYTDYHITTTKNHFDWAAEILADIIGDPLLEEKEVEKEKGVVIEEIRMYRDNPMMGMAGSFCQLMWQGSPRGCYNISGEETDIVGVNRERIRQYREKYFSSGRLVVVAAGDVSEEGWRSLEKYFGSLGNFDGKIKAVEVKTGEKRREKSVKSLEQGHFCLGLPTIGWEDERRYDFKILDMVLNGGSASRLNQKIREENGWAYYVFGVGEQTRETGYWAVQSGVRKDKIREAERVVEVELESIKDSLADEEVERVKQQLLGRTTILKDRSDFWAEQIGKEWLLRDRMVDIDEEIEKLMRVKTDRVKEMAAQFLRKEEIRLLEIE